MPNFQHCVFIGHLCKDPVLRYTTNNTPVVSASIAVNHNYNDKDGNKHEEVMFLDFSAFGKVAENINKYFAKGKPILLTGRLKLDKWQDKETGANRSKHELVVNSFTFVGGKGDSQGGQTERQHQPEPQQRREPEYDPRDDDPFAN